MFNTVNIKAYIRRIKLAQLNRKSFPGKETYTKQDKTVDQENEKVLSFWPELQEEKLFYTEPFLPTT